MILLSGPEPNRTHLEEKLLKEFKNFQGNIVLVRGTVDGEPTMIMKKDIKIYNYLCSSELEKELNQSEFVICRSGYSSIMDLAALGKKKVFFIPTKGQNEQEYLAKHIASKQIAPYASEQTFTVSMLEQIKSYKGFNTVKTSFQHRITKAFSSVKENIDPSP